MSPGNSAMSISLTLLPNSTIRQLPGPCFDKVTISCFFIVLAPIHQKPFLSIFNHYRSPVQKYTRSKYGMNPHLYYLRTLNIKGEKAFPFFSFPILHMCFLVSATSSDLSCILWHFSNYAHDDIDDLGLGNESILSFLLLLFFLSFLARVAWQHHPVGRVSQ